MGRQTTGMCVRVVTFLAFVHIFIAGEASESSVLISGTPHHDYAGPCMIDPSRKLGKLNARTNFYRAGGNATFTCVLDTSIPGLHAANVSFMVGDQKVNKSRIKILKDNKARLEYGLLEEQQNMHNVVCCVLMDRPDVGTHKVLVNFRVINVGHPPFKPVIENVEIRNWENLYVKWTVTDVNVVFFTNYTIHWNDSSGRHGTFSAGKVTRSDVIESINRLKFPPGERYSVWITGTNVVGDVSSSVYTLLQRGNVRPDPVTHVQEANITSTSADITWESPSPGHMIVYTLTLTSPWDIREEITRETSNYSLIWRLSGLIPHTRYQVSLAAATSANRNLSSEVVYLNLNTLTTVPATAPLITPGAYEELLNIKHDYRSVRIYWQPLPEKNRNGILSGYDVIYLDDTQKQIRKHVKLPQCSVEIHDLNQNLSSQFYIEAVNTHGRNTSLVLTPISIMPQIHLRTLFDNLTATLIRDSRIMVTWEGNSDVTNVTLFYCTASPHKGCEDALQWRQLTANEVAKGKVTHDIDDLESTKVRFGLSGQDVNGYQPIQWSNCLYDVRQVAPVPRIEEVLTESHAFLIVLHKPPCGHQQLHAFVYAYRLLVCVHMYTIQKSSHRSYPCRELLITDLTEGRENVVDGLQPDKEYVVKAWTMTRAGQSTSWAEKRLHTLEGDSSGPVVLVLVCIGSVLCLVFSVIGVYGGCRLMKKRYQKFSDLPVTLPERTIKDNITKYNEYVVIGKDPAPQICAVIPQPNNEMQEVKSENECDEVDEETVDEYAAAEETDGLNPFGCPDDDIDSGNDTEDDVTVHSGAIEDPEQRLQSLAQSSAMIGKAEEKIFAKGWNLGGNPPTLLKESPSRLLPRLSTDDGDINNDTDAQCSSKDDTVGSYAFASEADVASTNNDFLSILPGFENERTKQTFLPNIRYSSEDSLSETLGFTEDIPQVHGGYNKVAHDGTQAPSNSNIDDVYFEECEPYSMASENEACGALYSLGDSTEHKNTGVLTPAGDDSTGWVLPSLYESTTEQFHLSGLNQNTPAEMPASIPPSRTFSPIDQLLDDLEPVSEVTLPDASHLLPLTEVTSLSNAEQGTLGDDYSYSVSDNTDHQGSCSTNNYTVASDISEQDVYYY